MRKLLIAVPVALVLAFGGSALLPASAAEPKERGPWVPTVGIVDSISIKNGEVKAVDLAKDAVSGYNVKDGTLYGADLAPALIPWFTNTYNNTVGFPALKPEVATKLDLGTGSVKLTVPTTTIANIGGPFAANATNVGTFTLQAGTWLVTTNAVFNRTEAATATDPKTLPQLALRYPGDAGTIMGNDISTAVGRELMGATVKTVTVTESTTVTVYGFGYNDNGSAFASGKINVAAEITATKIG